MPETGFDVFDKTVHKSHAWLREIMDREGIKDRHAAYLMLRSTLHSLRDRLPPDEAVELGAQLPMLLRGMYFEGWKPKSTPHKWNREEFLDHVLEQFRTSPGQEADIDPERVVSTVFSIIGHNISEGEVQNIRGVLPKEIQRLWPTA